MQKKIYIITYKLYDYVTRKYLIGGIQTYIRDLCLVCNEAGHQVQIIQISGSEDWTIEYDGIKIINKATKSKSLRKSYQRSFNEVYTELNTNDSLFIISTDQMDVKSKGDNVITIQHGIAFDIPGNLIPDIWGKLPILQSLNKFFRCYKNVQRMYNTKRIVCVDYNYYNWFRTLGTIRNENSIKIIPNYTSTFIDVERLHDKVNMRSKTKKIIFARRFVDYRGALLFANVIKRMIDEHFDIEVTFAGSGPLLGKVKKQLENYNNVHFTSFSPENSITFHEQFDIAVVPTIFSEGTSLSLLEAMAAGCFPVATHVGGMTNVLMDGYNGRLISPTEDSLYKCLCEVITMQSTVFDEYIFHAYETVVYAFSKSSWKKKWLEIISE